MQLNNLQVALKSVFPNAQIPKKVSPTARKQYVYIDYHFVNGVKKKCRPAIAEIFHFLGTDKVATVNGDVFHVIPAKGKMEHHKEQTPYQWRAYEADSED